MLPWKFTPQQREVRVLPGETALAFYTATNKGPNDIIGVATYSVTPGQVSPYFSKIQCFCFEEQRLNAGETVDMPVFFFIDPEFVNDPAMKGIETITLSYTFFSMLLPNQVISHGYSMSKHLELIRILFQKRNMMTKALLNPFLAHNRRHKIQAYPGSHALCIAP